MLQFGAFGLALKEEGLSKQIEAENCKELCLCILQISGVPSASSSEACTVVVATTLQHELLNTASQSQRVVQLEYGGQRETLTWKEQYSLTMQWLSTSARRFRSARTCSTWPLLNISDFFSFFIALMLPVFFSLQSRTCRSRGQ